MRYKKQAGFTLIELLVVIVIITVLGMIGMTSYRSANQRSRDARRQADMEQVRAALEMYRTDNDTYPGNGWAVLLEELVGKGYLSSSPTDPLGGDYYYFTDDGGATYGLCALLEGSDPSSCNSSSAYNYGARNPL